MPGVLTSNLSASVLGALLALFLLIGRWTPARLEGIATRGPLYAEPRLWLAVAIAAVAIWWSSSLPSRQVGLPRSVVVGSLLFFAWVLASAAWAVDEETSGRKLYELSLVFAVVVAVQVALRKSSARATLRACWWTTVAVLLILAFLGIISVASSSRLAVLGGGPNVYGRNMALLGLGALYMHYARPNGSWGWLVVAAGSVPLVTLTGSRGAMLSGLCAGALAVWFYNRGFTRKVQSLMLSTLLTALLFLSELGQLAIQTFQHRVIELTFERTYSAGRSQLFQAAWDLGLEHPGRGVGLGGFTTETGWTYPHNLFLEVFSETGGVGLVLLGLFLLACGRALARTRPHVDAGTAAAALLFFIASQFSGSLYDTRSLWVWVLLALAAAREAAADDPPPPSPVDPGSRRLDAVPREA